MTGTSLDGIDVALVRVAGRGETLGATVLAHDAAPLGPAVDTLRALADGRACTARAIAEAQRHFALALAEALAGIADGRAVDLAVVHGQTVFHEPPCSWQLLDPAPIASRLGCPVAHHLRGADLAAGGQGAPITPRADWVLFRGAERRAIVNLGGFCNVTILPAADDPRGPAAVQGFDLCPCNHLLDAAARRVLDRPYDDGGRAAAGGTPHAPSVAAFTARWSSPGGRSLGTGDEAWAWLDDPALPSGGDLLATTAAAIGAAIGAACRAADVGRVLLAGGSARHAPLAAAIERGARATVEPTDVHGVPIAAREAAAMAVLGALALDGVPIGLPSITGATRAAPGLAVFAAGHAT